MVIVICSTILLGQGREIWFRGLTVKRCWCISLLLLDVKKSRLAGLLLLANGTKVKQRIESIGVEELFLFCSKASASDVFLLVVDD